ncbi:glycosyltransferase family 39 protein [Methanosphaera sp.]
MVHLSINSLKNKLFVVLALFMVFYTSILVYCQSIRGISYWDIFVYLQNAMLFAHINIGSQLSVPPVLSLLVSIPFQLGFISETTMFAVSGVLFIILILGIYQIFNEKFSPQISFVGSIFFSMLSLVVTWAVTGSNDLPSLAFSVWAVYFTMKGLNDNFNYYYVAFLCFVVAFFTRFTGGFILLVMLSYLILNFDKLKEQLSENNFKRLFFFMISAGIIIGGVYLIKQGTIPFLSQFIEVSSSSQVSSVNIGYELNPWYYIQNMPEFLTSLHVSNDYNAILSTVHNNPSPLSFIILFFMIVGLLKILYDCFRNYKDNDKKTNISLGVIIILSILTIISYTHISYIITEVLFVGILLLLYKTLPENFEQIDILMFIWMGIFIIMHSYHPVKVDRYILPIFIPIIYFMIQGIEHITSKINTNKKTTLTILVILLIILIPINISYMTSLTHENPHTNEEKKAATWLNNHDNHIVNENISSDRGVVFSWYLKKYTYTTIPRVLEANNETLENKLTSINAKYYIDSTSNTTNIEGYHTIYDNNNTSYKIKIYEKN